MTLIITVNMSNVWCESVSVSSLSYRLLQGEGLRHKLVKHPAQPVQTAFSAFNPPKDTGTQCPPSTSSSEPSDIGGRITEILQRNWWKHFFGRHSIYWQRGPVCRRCYVITVSYCFPSSLCTFHVLFLKNAYCQEHKAKPKLTYLFYNSFESIISSL